VKAAAALRVRLTNRTIKLIGCDFTSLKGVTPEAAQRYAEMLAAGNVTPRAAETASELSMRQRHKVEDRIRAAGYKLRFERNPDRDRSDRLTANLYWLERAQ
jgi:hypothetical protein